MLKCPVALREFGSTRARRRSTLKQPISRINILDASLVKFSRSDRVRTVMPGMALRVTALRRLHTSTGTTASDVPVSIRDHDVLDMKPSYEVEETYFHHDAPDPHWQAQLQRSADVASQPGVVTLQSQQKDSRDRVNIGASAMQQLPSAVRRSKS